MTASARTPCAGEHDVDRRVRGAEEHVVVDADDVADVGVDDAAVARDDDALARMGREDAFDRVHRALAEVEARLGVGVDVPALLVQHPLTDAEQQLATDEVDGELLGRDVAEDLDLAEVFEHDRLEAVMPGDLVAGLVGSLEVARVDDVDVLRAEAKADGLGLLVPSRRQRRIDRVADGRVREARDVLLAVAHEDQLGDVLDAGEEREVEHGGQAAGRRVMARALRRDVVALVAAHSAEATGGLTSTRTGSWHGCRIECVTDLTRRPRSMVTNAMTAADDCESRRDLHCRLVAGK